MSIDAYSYNSKITVDPRYQMRRLGDNVKIICNINTYSTIPPLWLFSGGRLPSNAVLTDNNLELTNVVPENTGLYTCSKRYEDKKVSDTSSLVVFGE